MYTQRRNDILVDQIRLLLITDCNNGKYKKFPDGSGVIEFDVRAGQLQKSRIVQEESLMEEEYAPNIAMSRKALEAILIKVTDRINTWEPINYGTIVLKFLLDEEGKMLKQMSIRISIESHFKRL